jgi:hypothetical protein
MFLIPILILAGGAIWLAAAKATSSTPAQQVNVAQTSADAANATAFVAQARALGLSAAQIQDAWDLGLSPQEYAAGIAPYSGYG